MFSKNTRKSIDKTSSSSVMALCSSSPQLNKSMVQIVKSCTICEMINIADKMRILCPYCGSFYDPKIQTRQAEKVQKNSLVKLYFNLKRNFFNHS